MYPLGITIILICLIPDISYQFTMSGFLIKPQLCSLFLYFLVFRRNLQYIAVLLFIYALIIRPFSGLGFTHIFFSYFIVLGVFYKLRTDIYIESYRVQPLWVFLMSFSQWVLVHILEWHSFHFVTVPHMILSGLLNSFILALIAMPIFLVWDYLYKLFGGAVYQDKAFSGSPMLRGKRRSKSLL